MIIACERCQHFACVCAILAEHAEGCSFRIAAAGAVGIECEHGFDVCPFCDPCTCERPGGEVSGALGGGRGSAGWEGPADHGGTVVRHAVGHAIVDQFAPVVGHGRRTDAGHLPDLPMTEPERCKHEMLINTCDFCRPRATSIEAPEQVEIRYWFVAKFDGSCPSCRRPVVAGEDWLARTMDGELVCEACPGVTREYSL